MNKFIYIFCFMFLIPAVSSGADQQNQEQGQIVIKTEQKGVIKSLLYKMWGKLRALNPDGPDKKKHTVSTAGIRGAETTDSLINPYWKDDRTNDKDYIKELNEYAKAQQLAEDGSLEGAVEALKSFIETYTDSDLKPNAQFALAISYGALGKNESSLDAFRTFVKDNPKHPLSADANQMIAELK